MIFDDFFLAFDWYFDDFGLKINRLCWCWNKRQNREKTLIADKSDLSVFIPACSSGQLRQENKFYRALAPKLPKVQVLKPKPISAARTRAFQILPSRTASLDEINLGFHTSCIYDIWGVMEEHQAQQSVFDYIFGHFWLIENKVLPRQG